MKRWHRCKYAVENTCSSVYGRPQREEFPICVKPDTYGIDGVLQRIQGDIDGWMNMTDPLDDTLTYNQTGLVSIDLFSVYSEY